VLTDCGQELQHRRELRVILEESLDDDVALHRRQAAHRRERALSSVVRLVGGHHQFSGGSAFS